MHFQQSGCQYNQPAAEAFSGHLSIHKTADKPQKQASANADQSTFAVVLCMAMLAIQVLAIQCSLSTQILQEQLPVTVFTQKFTRSSADGM